MGTYQDGHRLEALGDSTRRAIFERLAHGPLAVVDIARTLPVSRPAVSQHLKVLKDAGLVVDRAEGTRRVYQLDPKGIESLRAYFDRFWTDTLESFKRAAEESWAQEEQSKKTNVDQQSSRKKKQEKQS